MQATDITGQRYGRLLAVFRVDATRPMWRCACDCGDSVDVLSQSLRAGRTISCGCWKTTSEAKAKRGKARTTHGLTGSPTYISWAHMKERCTVAKCRQFKWYGGRGVKVCARWANSFEAFLADMGERPKGRTLDRFPDAAGNYEPGNCRWATPVEQAATMRRARKATQ